MRVWADCTAAAHPLVLRPIVERLREQGHEVEITTREYGQTVGILERLGLEHTVVGRHGGGSMVRKGSALAGRSAQLTRWARPKRFDLSVAHGSVDLALRYAFTRSLSLTVGADNLFDRYPTRWDTTRAAPFPQMGFTHCWETCPFGVNGRTMYARAEYAF